LATLSQFTSTKGLYQHKPAVKPARKRRRWRIVVGILVAAVLLFIGIPRLIRAFNTVSTDDAYVNGM